jgi:hypothetical protein
MMRSTENSRSLTSELDNLRFTSTTTRVARFAAGFPDRSSGCVPRRCSTHTYPALRVSGRACAPDAGVAKCDRSRDSSAGDRCAELGSSVGVFDGTSGGGDGRQKSQPVGEFLPLHLRFTIRSASHSSHTKQEEELAHRQQELLTDNAAKVLQILVQYAQVTGNYHPP